jgi:hypothetical protein
MSREPSGATAAYAMTVAFFAALGVMAGGVLWLCGQPWHRVLTLGCAGGMLGFVAIAIGIYLGGGSDNA